MKVLIATYGSRGDVQPYVALGKGLAGAGNEVVLATSCRFKDFVEKHGLAYGYMNDDLLSIIDTDKGRELVEKTTNVYQVVKQTLLMMKQLGPMQDSLLADSWKVAETFRPDVIVFHPKAYGGLHFCEKMKIPAVLALPFPMFVPTAEMPCMGFPDLGLGSWYNRMSYGLVNRIMGISAGSHVRKWRRDHGLAPGKTFSMLKTQDGRPVPVLHGVSPHVLARPGDWPETAAMTGYWFLDEAEEWQPDESLVSFLAAGPPPVYVGFGSMAGRDPGRMAGIVIKALEKAGARGILATGWGGLRPASLPRTVMAIDQAPHDWLFPRMAAVVHHGGAGTTAAGLRWGRPSIIIPFFGDQPFWGKQVHQLGAGSRPIPRKKLTAENLAAAISRVLSDPAIGQKASALGQRIQQEDGICAAVKAVEQVAAAF